MKDQDAVNAFYGCLGTILLLLLIIPVIIGLWRWAI